MNQQSMRANTGGKSLERGSAFGAMSLAMPSRKCAQGRFGSLGAGGAEIGGEFSEFHVTGEAMECCTQPRRTEARRLLPFSRGEANVPDMYYGRAPRGERVQQQGQRASGSSCMLWWSAPAHVGPFACIHAPLDGEAWDGKTACPPPKPFTGCRLC